MTARIRGVSWIPRERPSRYPFRARRPRRRFSSTSMPLRPARVAATATRPAEALPMRRWTTAASDRWATSRCPHSTRVVRRAMTVRSQRVNPSATWQRPRIAGLAMTRNADDWFGAGYDHSSLSIIGNTSTPTCVSCHDGSAATGRSLTHVPLPTAGQDCLVCHGTGFSSFALPTFDHAAAGITNNCASCHDGKAHDGVVVISKTPSAHPHLGGLQHVPRGYDQRPRRQWYVTSGFTAADPFVNTVHPAYTTGCRSCHNGSVRQCDLPCKGHPSRFGACHGRCQRLGMQCVPLDDRQFPGNQSGQPPGSGRQGPTVRELPCRRQHSGRHRQRPDASRDVGYCASSATRPAEVSYAGFDHTTLNTGGANHGLACTTCHDGVTATGKTATTCRRRVIASTAMQGIRRRRCRLPAARSITPAPK